MSNEQVGVAGDDEIGLRCERTGQHYVIVGIAGDLPCQPAHRHHVGETPILGDQGGGGKLGGGDCGGKLRARKHFGELHEQRPTGIELKNAL